MRQYQRRIGRESTQYLGGGTVTKVVETATQGLAIQRDAALPGGCARRLKQCGMATKTGLYRSRIEPLEDIADGGVRGRSTPSKTKRFVQPATMNVDERDDATGRIAAGHDGKNRKQQHGGNPLFCQSPHFGRTLLQIRLSPGGLPALNSLASRP